MTWEQDGEVRRELMRLHNAIGDVRDFLESRLALELVLNSYNYSNGESALDLTLNNEQMAEDLSEIQIMIAQSLVE